MLVLLTAPTFMSLSAAWASSASRRMRSCSASGSLISRLVPEAALLITEPACHVRREDRQTDMGSTAAEELAQLQDEFAEFQRSSADIEAELENSLQSVTKERDQVCRRCV